VAVERKLDVEKAFVTQKDQFAHWEKIKDCIDQYIDIMLKSDSGVSQEIVGTVQRFYVSKK
jgi:hypothetical protein